MNHAEAVQVVAEINERLSLLKEYVRCRDEFELLQREFRVEGNIEDWFALVCETVAKEFGITKTEMLNTKRRPDHIVIPRHTALYICYAKSHKTVSSTEVATWFKQDHTTVLNAVQNTENRLQTDKRFREKYAEIENKLKGETK